VPDDAYDRYLIAPPGRRRALLEDDDVAAAVRRHLGDAVFDELQRLPLRRDAPHLGDTPTNVLLVPGVMGTLLQNSRKAGIWWIDVRNVKHLDDLGLTADGTADADKGSLLLPTVLDQTYEPFLVNAQDEEGFAVDMFPYDWRRSLWEAADSLADRIGELHAESGQRINLVAHSMGGLVVRAALAAHGERLWPIVDKVVFLGTPHFGAAPIASYLKNHFWGFEALVVLGFFLSRQTFRSMWGPLFLMPAPVGVYPGTRGTTDPKAHPCANFDLYSAGAWDLDLTVAEEHELQTILDAAGQFHHRLWAAHQALEQDQLDRMLMVAGVGSKTLYRIETGHLLGTTKKVTREHRSDPNRVGDSRVPLASAQLDWLSNLRYTRAKHAALPNAPSVHADVFRFLRGQPLQLPTTPQGAFAGHLGEADESVTPTVDGSSREDWDVEDVDDATRAALLAKVDARDYPALELARIM